MPKPPAIGAAAAGPKPDLGAAEGRVNVGELAATEEIDAKEQQRSILFAKARLLEADGQPAKAAANYEAILKLDPRHGPSLHRLAVVRAEQGKIDEADECFQKALQVDAGSAELHSDYGYFCYLVRRWNDAEEHLHQALALDPELQSAHTNLGLLAARRGDAEGAMAHFRRGGCTLEEGRENLALVARLDAERAEVRQETSSGPQDPEAGFASLPN